MQKRMAEAHEVSNRNAEQERLEKEQREVYQLKKSEAIIMFEDVMSQAFTDSLCRTTFQIL